MLLLLGDRDRALHQGISAQHALYNCSTTALHSPCTAQVPPPYRPRTAPASQVRTEMHMSDVTICYGMTETSPVSFQTSVEGGWVGAWGGGWLCVGAWLSRGWPVLAFGCAMAACAGLRLWLIKGGCACRAEGSCTRGGWERALLRHFHFHFHGSWQLSGASQPALHPRPVACRLQYKCLASLLALSPCSLFVSLHAHHSLSLPLHPHRSLSFSLHPHHPTDPLDRRVSTVGRIHPHLEARVVEPGSGKTVPHGAVRGGVGCVRWGVGCVL